MAHNFSKKSPEENERLGRELYVAKKYEEALAAFTEVRSSFPIAQKVIQLTTYQVVEKCNESRISALEGRVATYEKLGKLDLALADARRIIKFHRSASQGYLRTGKILRLQDKVKAANRVYEVGLERVTSTDANIKLLRAAFIKTRGVIGSDPFLSLPVEVAYQVANLLDYKTHLRCLRVSTQWKELLLSWSKLWQEVDFPRITRKHVNRTVVKSCFERAQGNITKAVFYRLGNGAGAHFLCLKAVNLRHLEVLSSPGEDGLSGMVSMARRLSTLVYPKDCEIATINVVDVLVRAPQLEHVDFPNIVPFDGPGTCVFSDGCITMHKLEVMKFEGVKIGLFGSDCSKYFPNLRELTFISRQADEDGRFTPLKDFPSFQGFKKLTYLKLSSIFIKKFPDLPSQLQHLDLSNGVNTVFETSEGVGLTRKLPELTTLILSGCSGLTLDTLRPLLVGNRKKLVTFEYDSTRALNSQDILSMMAKEGTFTSLKNFRTHFHLSFSDECAESLVKIAPNLRRIGLAFTMITGVAIRTFLEKLEPNLEYLDVVACPISVDAIELARKAGVFVNARGNLP
ncbi:MAG: hypothetical protein M1814_005014 [Vezdaea aestivalis]|nr:MAG: hypothetical protein M1814_005014 [Vezdaea aestivalis]